MSLHPLENFDIPAETKRVAEAAFPKGNTYMKMRDELGVIYTDEAFIDLFPSRGQPAMSPARLALVTAMQFAEGLSDRATTEAVRGRIDWKYALGLPLEDAGFDASILSEFRTRLIDGDAEMRLFEMLLDRLRQAGLLKARGRMRTDSTHVLSAVRELNRLEFVGETLRQALNLLATIDPEWLQSWVPTEWFERYKRRFEEYRLPSSREKRYELGEQIGRDGMALWERLAETPTLKLLRNLPALEIFRLVWLQQYQWEKGKLRWRQKGNLPSATQMISTPYDREARYSTKRQTSWVGYKVHLTETCDDESPHLIVNVETNIATTPDYDATPIIHNQLKERDLLPAEHLVDAGYPSSDHLVSSQEHGIELVGPVSSDPSWQARANEGYDAASFTIDWEKQLAICPQGQTSNRWMSFQQNKQMMFNFRFPRGSCLKCEVRAKCTKSATHARSLLIQPQPAYEALHEARQHQKTDEFKQRYAKRAGIEGTISQGVAIVGLRQARYIGLAKTHLQHLMTAIGINLHRLGDWWAEQTRAQTRISPFASLAPT